MRKLIQLVIEEISKKDDTLIPSGHLKKVVAVFTGGIIGLDDAFDQLQELQKKGYLIEVIFTTNGERIIGVDKITEMLGDVRVYIDEKDFMHSSKIYQEADALIIPVLTTNTLGKIVHGITDNIATLVISQFLLSGKQVIAASDACDLDHPYRREVGMNKGTRAYRQIFYDHIKELKEFGVVVCSVKNLMSHFVDKEVSKYEMCSFSDKVLSVANLEGIEGTIIVGKDTIITPAAQDMIKEKDLKISFC